MDILIAAASYIGAISISLLIADLMTGFVHWFEDTWLAPGTSTLLDRFVVNDNIDHHRHPGKIRAGHYWETNRVCIALAAGAAVILALLGVHAWEPYLVLALLSQSNQVHMWAHSSSPPRPVAWLQRIGMLQSTRQHAQHHKRPYGSRFCTMTNYLNPLLDRVHFWRGLERVAVRCGATVQRAGIARGGY
jgi:ubiquitin-conjugating enzyme E2 variant